MKELERPNHVWSYDFVEDRTHEWRKYRMLNITQPSSCPSGGGRRDTGTAPYRGVHILAL
jgi:hypothetical protein